MSRRETLSSRPRWDLTDAAILLGLGLVVAGIALVYPPAALIVGGLVLVGLAMFNGGT